MYTALMLQALGKVDVTFAGLTHSTGDVIMAGQMVVGLQEGISTISSVGIFNIPSYEGSEGSAAGLRRQCCLHKSGCGTACQHCYFCL